MWDDLQNFLDYLIAKYGILRVLLGPIATIGLLASAGIVTGGSISAVATGVSLFVALVIISALILQLRSARELLAERARVVNFYTQQYAESPGPFAFTIEDWDETVNINKHGDATLERWVTIKVGDEPLYSIWAGVWTQSEINDAQRRRVKVEARGFNEINGSRVLGARYDVTSTWQGQKIKLFVHFEQPAPAGATVRVWLRWEWPAYYESLVKGGKDIVEWIMHRPNRRIALKMFFDKGTKMTSAAITPYLGCPMPTQEPHPDGGLMVSIVYSCLQLETKVGFTIDKSSPRH